MNNRELLHALLDKLLDIQESSSKVVFFSYSGHTNTIDYQVCKNRLAYDVKFAYSFCVSVSEDSVNKAITQIAGASMIEDEPVEKMVEVKLSESKAKELGLIA
jgi:hypothetical protein